MSAQIDFLTFKNILNNNNVFLFDAQYRIAHFRYNQLVNNLPQIGGSDSIKPEQILTKLTTIKDCMLCHFVDSLVANNIAKTNYIISQLN